MELQDRGAEVESSGASSLLKNRFVQVVAALLVLGFLGCVILVLFVFRVLPAAGGFKLAGAQRTPTGAAVAQATQASTSATPLASTPAPSATPVFTAPAGTPGSIPTTTPAASASATQQATPSANLAPGGLYVTRLRAEPVKPRKGEPITFFTTFTNTTGNKQVHRLCVEVYRLGEDRSFGITSCPPQTVPLGTSELMIGTWTLTGIHECLPVRARAITNDEGEPRVPLGMADGSPLWFDLTVCP